MESTRTEPNPCRTLRIVNMAAILASGSPSLVSGQRVVQPRAIGFRGVVAEAHSAPTEISSELRLGFIESRTFWKEGGIIGGGLTMAAGILFFFGARRDYPPGPSLLLLPPAAAVSFLVGAGPGAFIGGLIPKPKPEAAVRP